MLGKANIKEQEPYLELLISVISWILTFGNFIPIFFGGINHFISPQISNVIVSEITVVLCFILGAVISTILVKKQNLILKTKPIGFRKKYYYALLMVFCALTALNLFYNYK